MARAVWAERLGGLVELGCPEPTWACVAGLAGSTLSSGDRVRTGMPSIDSLSGLAVAAAQARDLTGRDDFASNDFDGGFRALAGALAAGSADDPLATMRLQGPGRFTLVGTTTAAATSVSSTFGTIDLVVDPVTVDVVVAVPSGVEVRSELGSTLRRELLADGWTAPDDPALDPADGLPGGGVLAALRTIWRQ